MRTASPRPPDAAAAAAGVGSVELASAEDPAAAFRAAAATGRLLTMRSGGTSGAPRTVVRTVGSWSGSFDAVTELTGLSSASRVWVPGPTTASMNVFALVHADHVGAAVVASAEACTHAVLTPARLALDVGRFPAGATVVVAGDRLRPALRWAAEKAGLRVCHYYGAAELSFVAWGADEESLEAFPRVEVEQRGGELWVRSPYLFKGYDGAPGPARWDPDGFLSVGDRGMVHRDRDRERDRIRVGGRSGAVTTAGATVHLAEVEVALRPSAAGEVVAVGLPHDRLGAVVAAVLTDATDRDRLRQRALLLPEQARPRVWLHLTDPPATVAGKLDRAALEALARDGSLRRLT